MLFYSQPSNSTNILLKPRVRCFWYLSYCFNIYFHISKFCTHLYYFNVSFANIIRFTAPRNFHYLYHFFSKKEFHKQFWTCYSWYVTRILPTSKAKHLVFFQDFHFCMLTLSYSHHAKHSVGYLMASDLSLGIRTILIRIVFDIIQRITSNLHWKPTNQSLGSSASQY